MRFFEALQVVLVFSPEEENYKRARQTLTEYDPRASSEAPVLGKNFNDYLKILFTPKEYQKYVSNGKLSDDLLLKLPNLFRNSLSSREYNILRECLRLWGGAGALSQEVIDYFQHLLDKKVQNVSVNIKLEALSILLGIFYGINGLVLFKTEKDPAIKHAVKESIKSLLCSNVKIDESKLSKKLIVLFDSLKEFLNHPTDRSLRLQARSICESLNIPLNLERMLGLSIDGVQQDSAKAVDNLVLVVGVTGAGKSATINYLCGIEHDLVKNPATATKYLQPKPGQPDTPVRTGHKSISQTLYPQTVYERDYSYCDSPGFQDNRKGDEAVCAALGVPLAIHYSKLIRAVLVVIEWNTTDPTGGARGATLRLLNHTLSKLFNEIPKGVGAEFPILFAITKPPPPDRGELFNTGELRDQIVQRIEDRLVDMQNVDSSIRRENEEKELQGLALQLRDLNQCLDRLPGLVNFLRNPKAERQRHFGLATRIVASLSGQSDVLGQAEIENIVREQGQAWYAEGFSRTFVERLQNILRRVMQAKSPLERDKEEREQLQAWDAEKSKLEDSILKLKLSIEEAKGEENILRLICAHKENVFIIRGYKDNHDDEPDHRDALLGSLRTLHAKGISISRDQFSFNPLGQEFSRVRRWAEDFSMEASRNLRALLELQKEKEILKRKIDDKNKEIENEKKQLVINMQAQQREDLGKELEEGIELRSIKLKKLQVEQKELESDRQTLLSQISKINEAPVEAHDTVTIDERMFFFGLMSYTSWDYSFPGSYIYEGKTFKIPIQHVEISNLTKKQDGKAYLVFRGDKNESCQLSNQKILVSSEVSKEQWPNEDGGGNVPIFKMVGKESDGYQTVGQVTITHDLSEGILKIHYRSAFAEDGYVAVRVFVFPRDLLENRQKIDGFRKKIEEKDRKLLEMKEEVGLEEAHLKADIEQLELIRRGLYDQAQKVKRIQTLLGRLGYTKNIFLDEFFPEHRPQMIWLEDINNFNKLRELLRCQSAIFESCLGRNEELFCMYLLGVPAKEVFTPNVARNLLVKDIEERLRSVPLNILNQMYEVSKNRGLALSSLHLLMNGLKIFASGKSMIEELSGLKQRELASRYCLEKLKVWIREYSLRVQTFDVVKSLFDMPSRCSTVREYDEIRHQIIERKVMQEKSSLTVSEREQAEKHVFSCMAEYESLTQLECWFLMSRTDPSILAEMEAPGAWKWLEPEGHLCSTDAPDFSKSAAVYPLSVSVTASLGDNLGTKSVSFDSSSTVRSLMFSRQGIACSSSSVAASGSYSDDVEVNSTFEFERDMAIALDESRRDAISLIKKRETQ